jgi:hypothetical protein
MKCALCHSLNPLRNSHIIPEFQYKPIYDPKHRLLTISSNPQKRDRYVQKGLREKLLCDACEILFSGWEDYSFRVLFGDTAKLHSKTEKTTHLKGIDYPKFKLFLLSLLWRMSVAKGEFWKEVNLGPLEARLRECLLNSDPLTSDEFPCLLCPVLIDGHYDPGWLMPPDKIRVNGCTVYRIIINGVLFSFFASSQADQLKLGRHSINERGEMKLIVEEARQIPYVSQILFALGKAINQRKDS